MGWPGHAVPALKLPETRAVARVFDAEQGRSSRRGIPKMTQEICRKRGPPYPYWTFVVGSRHFFSAATECQG